MDPITLIFWQFLALLLAGLIVCGLLILVSEQRERVRDERDKAAEERAAHREARAEARGLYVQVDQLTAELRESRQQNEVLAGIHAADRQQYEHLADELAAQNQVIETFINNGITDLEDRS